MTYDSILAAVKRYMNRDDITAEDYAHWVALTEVRLHEMLRLQEMHKGAAFTVPIANTGKLNVPARFIEFTSITVDEKPLSQMSEEQMANEMRDENSRCRVDNKPTYYSRSENYIQIWPYHTGEDMSGNMWYYEMPEAITPTNQSNIITTTYGDIYFWRILSEAYHRYGYDERVGPTDARFQEAITAAQNLTKRAEFSGSVQRIRPRKQVYKGY